MEQSLIVLVLLMMYFTTMGFLTVFESKVLGLIQNSMSIFKFSFLGLYSFYLDFLKVLLKGFFSGKNKKFSFYNLNLVLMMMVISLNFMNLMFSFLFKKEFYFYSLIIFLVLDTFVLVLKMLLLSWFESKFLMLGVYSISWVYILVEGVFSYIVLLALILNKNFLGEMKGLVAIVSLGFLFSFTLVKMFSIPFDYFESESELVGGAVLEFQSLGFLLWSLLEYGLILNNCLFLVYLLNLFLNGKMVTNILVLMFLMINTFLISGVLVSVSFYTTMNFPMYMFLMINTTIFIMVVLF